MELRSLGLQQHTGGPCRFPVHLGASVCDPGFSGCFGGIGEWLALELGLPPTLFASPHLRLSGRN